MGLAVDLPEQRLHVNGNALIEDSLIVSGIGVVEDTLFVNDPLIVSRNEDNDLLVFATAGTERFSAYAHGSGTDYLAFKHIFGASDKDLMALTQDGEVGINTTAPNSNLHINGSYTRKIYTATTQRYDVTDTDNVIFARGQVVDSLMLPDATTCPGRVYTIKSTSLVVFYVYPQPGQQIDNSSSLQLGDWASFTIISDGANWLILGD
jgi:hypothetical protein